MKKTKIGVISLSLMALLSCSTNQKIEVIPPAKVICPTVTVGQPHNKAIKTNADIVEALIATRNALAISNIALETTLNCIEKHNNGLNHND